MILDRMNISNKNKQTRQMTRVGVEGILGRTAKSRMASPNNANSPSGVLMISMTGK